MRFSGITGYLLQVKSENLYISDVTKIILHVVSMWDMEIPRSGQNFGSGTRQAILEFPYPTSIQIKRYLNICVNMHT
jgi:hypothetical protein